jgi:hypothetical protein
VTTFPALTPSSRTLSLGDYSHAPLRTMGGSQMQVRHSNVVVGGGLELGFLHLDEADMLLIRTHFINRRGRFLVFALPSAIWFGTTDPTPADYNWRYKDIPTVEDVGGGFYDVTVPLELMPPDPSGSIANTQDVVIMVPNGVIRTQALAPDILVSGLVLVPAGAITLQGLAPDIITDLLISVPATTVTVTPLAPTYG